MSDLHDVRVAIIAMDGFEESELVEPRRALQAAGATVDVISAGEGEIQGFHHFDKTGRIRVDKTLDQVTSDDYDALMLPGGALNADHARANPKVRAFIRGIDRDGKPMAVICHAPWELISAGIIRGRKLTSWHSIEDDICNAGAEWTDREVVVDRNLVTSRGPKDLPAFNREMLTLFSRIHAGAHL
jgi:protease I